MLELSVIPILSIRLERGTDNYSWSLNHAGAGARLCVVENLSKINSLPYSWRLHDHNLHPKIQPAMG